MNNDETRMIMEYKLTVHNYVKKYKKENKVLFFKRKDVVNVQMALFLSVVVPLLRSTIETDQTLYPVELLDEYFFGPFAKKAGSEI